MLSGALLVLRVKRTATALIFLVLVSPPLSRSSGPPHPSLASTVGSSYFVDNSCLHNGDGTAQYCAHSSGSPGPFNSLSNMENRPGGYRPGDSILLKRGDIFREELKPSASGTQTSPITFGAYGDAARPKPIITGSDIFPTWSAVPGRPDTYAAASRFIVRQLFLDGKRSRISRWPDTGWQTIAESSKFKTSLSSDSLTQDANYWTNATITVRTEYYRAEEATVLTNSPERVSRSVGSISWDTPMSISPARNFGFYLENLPNLVQAPGSWAFSAGRLYLALAPGDIAANHRIEGTVRDYGIVANGVSYVVFDSLAVSNAGLQALRLDHSVGITIRNCSFDGSRRGGILIKSSPNSQLTRTLISGNDISNTLQGSAIEVDANDSSILNNTVTDTGSDLVSPKDALGIVIHGNNTTVSGNVVSRVSRDSIFVGPTVSVGVVSNNLLSDFLMCSSDGGAIYGTGNHSDLLISNNLIYSGHVNLTGTPGNRSVQRYGVVGVYLDQPSSGATVFGNVIYGVPGWGISINDGSNNQVFNNTIYGAAFAGIALSESTRNSLQDNAVANNIVYLTEPSAYAYYEHRVEPVSQKAADADFNLYYSEHGPVTIGYRAGLSTTPYSLAAWTARYGMDAHSIESNPEFTDPSVNDFSLRASSRAINSGRNLGDKYRLGLASGSTWPSALIFENQTASGQGWDMGAFVYHP